MEKQFNTNSIFLYAVAAVTILFILAQSFYFLIRAVKRAKAIEMDKAVVWKTISSTAIFTIAPAFSILLGVVTLSQFLGLPLPWIRLSVIGAITYELPAATSTAKALNISLSEMITDPKTYTAIAWVMTLGILPSSNFNQKNPEGHYKDSDQRFSLGQHFYDLAFYGNDFGL